MRTEATILRTEEKVSAAIHRDGHMRRLVGHVYSIIFAHRGKTELRNGSPILYTNADTETQGRGFLANCQERLTLPPGINSGYLTVRTLTLCWFHGPHVSVCRRPKNGSRAVIKQKEGERVCV